MNIHCTSHGQGLPVVLFHGWGFDQQVWLPLVNELGKHYCLFLVDLPGFGSTPMMDWATFKRQLLSRLPQQFAVVGWSLGGLFAQRLAIEEQGRVLSLMSIASSPRFIADKEWPTVAQHVFMQFYYKLSLDIEGTLNEFVSVQLNKNKTPLTLGRIPAQEGLEEGLKILSEWDLRQGLQHVTQPGCFLFGRLDSITPARIMTIMKTVYPQFSYVLFKHSAHMPFMSQQDLFIEEFKRFIQ